MENQPTLQDKETPSLPPTPRSAESNSNPTTFVQADTSSFKQVVQMLTGFAETTTAAVAASKNVPNLTLKATGPKKQAFKLYERRNSLKNLNLMPIFQNPKALSPRKQPDILSPSILDFPSLVLSPVTPLIHDPFNRAQMLAEEKAIADKGFYLHPSPRGSNQDGEVPTLLPLFPVASPRASSSGSGSNSSP